jgi:hypothetical protein
MQEEVAKDKLESVPRKREDLNARRAAILKEESAAKKRLTVSLSLSLYLSHTHSLSLSLSLSIYIFLSPFISFSRSSFLSQLPPSRSVSLERSLSLSSSLSSFFFSLSF